MMLLMFEAALAALREIISPPFRNVLLKSLGMTLVMLSLAWVGLDKFLLSYAITSHPWVQTALTYVAGMGLFILLAFLIGPISVVVTSLFLDDLADVVERDLYPESARGSAIPVSQAILMGLRFSFISAAVNVIALLLLLVPGVNAAAFLFANAYLLGREYFLFAATRFMTLNQALKMRQRYALQIFLAGFFIAAFIATPGLNVLTPLFGVAFMSRIYKIISQSRN